MQDIQKATTGRTDDGFSGVDVLVNAVLGVEHDLDPSVWDRDGHPDTTVRA